MQYWGQGTIMDYGPLQRFEGSMQYMAGRADLWSYNYTGVNGVGHVAPGSAGDWAVGVRGYKANKAVMSTRQFDRFYPSTKEKKKKYVSKRLRAVKMLVGGKKQKRGRGLWKKKYKLFRERANTDGASEAERAHIMPSLEQAWGGIGGEDKKDLIENSPLYIDGMILNTDNPYLYRPEAYFKHFLKSGATILILYSRNFVRYIKINGQGNLTERLLKSGPLLDVRRYTSNNGFFQLPRDYSRESLEEAMGRKYADLFWQVFTSGDGYFMANKPIKSIWAYLNEEPYKDITFRFRFDVNNFQGHNYKIILDVCYGY